MTQALPAGLTEALRRWVDAVTRGNAQAVRDAVRAASDAGEFSIRLMLRALQESGHAIDADWNDDDTAVEQMSALARSLGLGDFEPPDDAATGSDRIEQTLKTLSGFMSTRGQSLFDVDLGDDNYRAVAVRSSDEAAFVALSAQLGVPVRRP